MILQSKMRKIMDDTEHFLGIEIDEKKQERLNTMREICREIAEIEPQVKNPYEPFDNRSRHAMVTLEMESPFWTLNKRVPTLLADLMKLTDDLSICVVDGTDTIRVMCSVQDMWAKFGYDNDMEHGK